MKESDEISIDNTILQNSTDSFFEEKSVVEQMRKIKGLQGEFKEMKKTRQVQIKQEEIYGALKRLVIHTVSNLNEIVVKIRSTQYENSIDQIRHTISNTAKDATTNILLPVIKATDELSIIKEKNDELKTRIEELEIQLACQTSKCEMLEIENKTHVFQISLFKTKLTPSSSDTNNAGYKDPIIIDETTSLSSKAQSLVKETIAIRECTVCWNAISNTFFHTCGHFCICSDCVYRIKTISSTKDKYWVAKYWVAKCPICTVQGKFSSLTSANCHNCGKNLPSTYLGACGHLYACEECQFEVNDLVTVGSLRTCDYVFCSVKSIVKKLYFS